MLMGMLMNSDIILFVFSFCFVPRMYFFMIQYQFIYFKHIYQLDFTMEERGQQSMQQYFCKNHPGQQSSFFVIEQPQIKYCKSCALNMALCGRKIQKELTKQESRRKQIVSTVVEKIRGTILEVETNQQYYEQLASIIQFSSPSIVQKIEAVDIFIKQLIQIKQRLENECQNELKVKISAFNTKKKDLKQHQSKLVQQLQKIQSNFVYLIQMQNNSQFQTLRQTWNQSIMSSSRDFLKLEEFQTEREKIGDFLSIFQKQYREITKLRLPESILPEQNFLKGDWNKQNGSNQFGLNNFNCNDLVQELKLNLTANAKLKSRCNNTKRPNTEREGRNQGKKEKKSVHIEDGELFQVGKRINH